MICKLDEVHFKESCHSPPRAGVMVTTVEMAAFVDMGSIEGNPEGQIYDMHSSTDLGRGHRPAGAPPR
jgi:hypothetical protein